MQLRVIAVGARMPAWVDQAVDEFARRLPPEFRLEWRTVKAEPRGASGAPDQWRSREAQRIRDALPAGARLVLLDERGDDIGSEQLAQRLARWRDAAQPVALVIGGPDGVDAALRAAAHETIRLSTLTLPHALVRIVLAEQLFRAWSILAGHPYHRG
ncbi:MAG TPA: 23S rRNA (pseudouridine(1915)-N(3))-methyltransferase RlmH [Burkholderiaceae bacterium]|jgi:23S rRNA (pseudouridine1915-N3)-methyltransferase|nr:23S rRNA (pseudouridine(1915)-N(3))-methyltransferase RlmH [Burkholderiaceae bacterium]